jgi:hypothetical protein
MSASEAPQNSAGSFGLNLYLEKSNGRADLLPLGFTQMTEIVLRSSISATYWLIFITSIPT